MVFQPAASDNAQEASVKELLSKQKTMWIALVLYGLGLFPILGSAMINRLGPERGRLSLDNCRLTTDSEAGLISMLKDGNDGIRLDTRSSVAAAQTIPALADRLAAGEPVIREKTGPARTLSGYVVLDKSEEALAAWQKAQPEKPTHSPLIIRDGNRDMDRLVQKYNGKADMAIARGRLKTEVISGKTMQQMWLASPNPTLPQHARAILQDLPVAAQHTGACHPRFLLEIHYGALGDPWVSGLHPLSGP